VGTQIDEASADAPEHDSLREIRPWREIGWIFKDGDALAIERRGDRIRAGSAAFSHLRDE
jgi:hypothetical protein